MKILKFIITLIAFWSFASCSSNEEGATGGNLPPSTGKEGELVVVVEDEIWNSPVGDNLFNLMTVSSYGLPQDEPIFDLVRIPKESFTSIFETHRNVLFLKYGDDNGILIKKNLWATDQLVIELTGSSEQELSNLLEEYANEITLKYEATDIKKIQSDIYGAYNATFDNSLKEAHGFSLSIPKDYILDAPESSKNFYWLRKDTPQLTQCIWIHVQDYQDTKAFDKETIVDLRNTLGEKHVEGPNEGSYMGTEMVMPVMTKTTEIDGNYAVEARGLWKMEGDFMGGPFLSYTVLNKASNKIVTVEGFMYAPKYKKRNYMQQTEAILKTLTFE